MRSSARPARRGPARGRSRRRSSGSAATPPVRVAPRVPAATGDDVPPHRRATSAGGSACRDREQRRRNGSGRVTGDGRRRRAATDSERVQRFGDEGRTAAPPRGRTRWSCGRTGDRHAAGQGLRRPAASASAASRCGSRRPGCSRARPRRRQAPARTDGRPSPTAQRARARRTCTWRPAGRARRRRAAYLDVESVQGPRSDRRLESGRGFLPKHRRETLKMRAFLSSAGRARTHRKGATPVDAFAREPLASSSPRPLSLLLVAAARAEAPQVNTAGDRRPAPRGGRSELTAHNGHVATTTNGSSCHESECVMSVPVAEVRREARCSDIGGRRRSTASTRSQSADAGHALRVMETMCKHDCGALEQRQPGSHASVSGTSAATGTSGHDRASCPRRRCPDVSRRRPRRRPRPTGPKPQAPLAPTATAAPTVGRSSDGRADPERDDGNVERLRSADDRARVASLRPRG